MLEPLEDRRLLDAVGMAAAARVWFVDADAPGMSDGSSWQDAFHRVQDALAAAIAGDEVRVAEGVYTPAGPGGSRAATFQLLNTVTIRGGYAGFGAPAPNERDIHTHPTILSGDLSGNDGPGFANNAENSVHVVTGSNTAATAVLDGFTISGGNATAGGGMYSNSGSPTLIDCTFRANYASWEGGGVFNEHNSSPTMINCTFAGNQAGAGGGIFNRDYSSPTLINCLFTSNSSPSYGGGAMENLGHSSPALINCTFTGNSALWAGPAIYNMDWASGLTATNCVFWGNIATQTEAIVAPIASSQATVTYSCVQDSDPNDQSVFPGTGNVDDDPRFVDLYGADNRLGTGDEDARLLPGSPCANAGKNAAVPASVTTDLDGHPRIVDATVDMGAYEGPHQGFLLSTRSMEVGEGATAVFTIALAMNPRGTVQVQIAPHSGDADITVAGGGMLTFDSSNYATPQTVTVAAAEDRDRLNGTALVWVTSPGFTTAGITATERDNDAPAIVYVDRTAAGANDGSIWDDAYTDLQDALGFAALQPQVQEIRVAEGVYKPAGPDGPRTASFPLVNGVAIFGGFPRGGGTWEQRNPGSRETVLSGDLGGDDSRVATVADLLDAANRDDNSLHVVTADRCDESAVLDGFTVTGGNANGDSNDGYGGGIRGRRLTLRNCLVTENTARYSGGGINGEGMLSNCTIRRNASGSSSGGISAGGSTLTDCQIVGNWAGNSGGGLSGGSTLVRCQIIENVAQLGGGIDSGMATLNDCTVRGNRASQQGGGLYAWETDPILNNCTFIANVAGGNGGALSLGDSGAAITACQFLGNAATSGGAIENFGYSDPTLVNCTFSGNRADGSGGGVYNTSGSRPTLVNCSFSLNSAGESGGGVAHGDNYEYAATLANCVLWGNRDHSGQTEGGQISYEDIVPTVNYSCVQGLSGQLGGTGNIAANPRFVDANGADNTPGTRDDDLRLQAGSPCINAGDNRAVPPSVATDLDGNPRISGRAVDMGAYEAARVPEVVGRYVFYNHSAFDGHSAAANARDDGAIATDKQALLPGRTASFVNYTSYSRGLNGIMVDIADLPPGDLHTEDFRFLVGNSNDAAHWAEAPAPQTITVRRGVGAGGSDRVTLIWRDKAIEKQWLQVTVLATPGTGLARPDVFYFGNAIGESGNSGANARVDAVDMLMALLHPRTLFNPAPVDFPYDYNRDARVNLLDVLIARNNQTNFLTALKLIDAPGGKGATSKALHATRGIHARALTSRL